MPLQVVIGPSKVCRRINRHRDTAGNHDAEKARQIILPGAQHQRHCLPRPEPLRRQTGCDAPRGVQQVAVADRMFAMPIVMEEEMQPIRLMGAVPFECFHQGLCSVG